MTISDESRRLMDGIVVALQERGLDWTYPTVERGVGYDPDYHENESGTCMYTKPGGEPACIVGVALHREGFKVPAYGDPYNSVGSDELLSDIAQDASETTIQFMGAIQNSQDFGHSWGISVANGVELLDDEERGYFESALASAGIALPPTY